MDDTQQSRTSDAGATRKRRSSILKIQRAPRTPFSELEFNVATPTDSAKSRRVSFSRRTGVAEFVTNEATTTWKNFYEEHNKSLESSGNESGANAARQPIGHLGKRIFEQQFEEVEAADFITSLDNLAGRNVNSTMNINFTEQLASLEATDSMKPTAPQNNFELSALTDHHSKLFGDDLAMPTMGEGTGRIDINFSAVQSIDVKDDLDEIQRDIQRQSNVVGPPPFRNARDFSEYIEVELNSTHAAIRTEESDMSITETIPSPKVNVSKTLSPPDKKSSLNWVDKKENKRLDNLDVKAKTLIFESNVMSMTTTLPTKLSQESEKRRTILFEDAFGDLSMTKPLPVKLMVDDKENRHVDSDIKSKSFISNADMSMTAVLPGRITLEPEKRRTMIFDDELGDLSITRALPAKLIDSKEDIISKSLVFDRNTDMSMTEVLPGKLNQEPEKRRTIIFDDGLGDLSITNPIPAKLLSVHSNIIDKSILNEVSVKSCSKDIEGQVGKRRTILFDDNLGDLSMTKPIPAQMLTAHSEIMNKSKLIENFNKSIIQPTGSTTEKRKTVLFDDDLGDLSMTKPIPAKILSAQSEMMNKSKLNDINNKSTLQHKESNSEKIKTIIFGDDGDLSMTKPVPAKMISVLSEIINKSSLNDNLNKSNLQPKETAEKRKTILFDDDLGDLSITKPVPDNIILSVNSEIINKSKVNDNFNKSNLQPAEIPNKRNTILFEDDLGDLSITKPIPTKLLSTHSDIIDKSKVNKSFNTSRAQEISLRDKENTVEHVSEKPARLPEAEKSKENVTEKRKTILFDDGLGDLSMTKPIPAQLLSVHSEMIEKSINKSRSFLSEDKDVKSKTIVYEDDDDRANMSISPTIELPKDTEKRKTLLVVDIVRNIPAQLLSVHSEMIEKSINKSRSFLSEDKVVKSKTIVYEDDDDRANMSISPTIELPKDTEERKTLLVDDIVRNMSMTKPVSAELLGDSSKITEHTQGLFNQNHSIRATEKRNTIMFETDMNDISMTKPIPINILGQQLDEFNKSKEYNNKEVASMDFSKFKAQDVAVYQVATNETSINKEDELQQTEKEEEKELSRNVSINSVVMNVSVVPKKSLLCDLLDMSNSSLTSCIKTKDVSVKMSLEKHETASKMNTVTTESVTSGMLYITRDTDSESQSRKSNSITYVDVETNHKNISDESIPELVDNVQFALSELKDSNASNNKSFDQMETEDVGVGVTPERSCEIIDVPRYAKSFRDVDNTKDLLDMLSDLTDGRQSLSNEDPVEATSFRGHITLKNIETNELERTNRVSIAPSRQSIVLNREDLLNNISMAQAALQMSIEMEDSDIEEPTPAVAVSPPKKTVRVSNEVVKTLHFEDESSASEVSVKAELKSPLKKTAFGETTYMKETNKSNVIPSYLKDVSDGIKSLMHDLVKPVADEQPFESVGLGKSLKNSPSTCSTQIQANLVTSSQIDLPTELASNPESTHEMEIEKITNRMSVAANISPKSVSFTESDSHVRSDLVSRNLKDASFRPKLHSPEQLLPGKVLVFDHENPLNNVLLTPAEFTEVHNYSPPKDSNETLSGSGSDRSHFTQCSVRGNEEYEVENVSIKYDYHTRCQSGDSGADRISKNQSIASDISKPPSIDRSIDVRVTEVKDIEVNTAIVMKKNKELLEASSSLTLVDDAVAKCDDVDSEPATTNSRSNMSEANLKVIYKLKGDVNVEKLDSDLTSNNESEAKPKKRIYSPSSSEKQCSSSQNVTPKPLTKMQRLSNSPDTRNYNKRISSNKSISSASTESQMDVDSSPSKESPRKRSPRKKNSPKKEAMSITVQQLLTEFNVTTEIDQKLLHRQILEALSKTDSSAVPDSISERGLEMVDSFTSSKNQCKTGQSTTTTGTESTDSKEWLDKKPVLECDSSVNVVAKIDMLSFMGSRECEWASSGTDTWSFRLLHGRIRLTVRLAHRHHNSTRTRVRGDTPIKDVTVHESHHGNDNKNSVAMLCVSFATEAIRACASDACARAADVPALLCRAAAVARRALRWGRAMHEARMHLAYTLSNDGKLVLKVANIPLRCVWEVSMKLELFSPGDGAPYPRAGDVRVSRVLAGGPVRADAVRAVLAGVPAGWPHAPTSLWRIFKYLKNKTAEDDSMGLRGAQFVR